MAFCAPIVCRATFLLPDPKPPAPRHKPVNSRRGLCVQAGSGIDVASLHASIPAESRVTPSLPRKSEERDDVHHEPAERANSMKVAAIAEFSTIPCGLCLVKVMNPTCRS